MATGANEPTRKHDPESGTLRGTRSSGKKKRSTEAFREEVMGELATNPAWQVHSRAGYWICPYCGIMGARWNGEDKPAMVAEIVGHFAYRCTAFKGGRGEPMEAARVREYATLNDLARTVRKEPAWNVRDAKGRWYCPANGARTPIAFKGEQPSIGELRHVRRYLKACPEYQNREPLLSEDELKLAVRLWTDPHFRCYDALGRWYNPFTLRATDILLDRTSKQITRAQIESTWKLLGNSIDYVTHKGRPPEPLEHVLDAVRNGQKKALLARELRKAVTTDPVWTVSGDDGWRCPFCREEVGSVDISSPFLLKRIAPRQMARHLVDDCGAYHRGEAPAATVADMLGTDTGSGERSRIASGRHDYEAAARAYDSLTKPAEAHDEIAGRIMAVRPTEQEAEAHKEVQQQHKQVMERARQVQLGMLPKIPADLTGIEISAYYKACEDVGGDFYDFVRVSETELGLVMGDVSGHGIHAALVMAAAKKSLQIHGKGKSSPHEALCVVNDDLRPELPPQIFVTIFYGVLNLETLRLRWVRAGHNPLMLYNPDRDEPLQEFEPPGMIVGMAPSAMFGKVMKEHTIDLKQGDVIFQYTDGVTEAMDPENNEYGEDRLRELFREHGAGSLEAMQEVLTDDVEKFRRGAEPNDDVTLLFLRVLEPARREPEGPAPEVADAERTAPAAVATAEAVPDDDPVAEAEAVESAEAIPEAGPVDAGVALPDDAELAEAVPAGSSGSLSTMELEFDMPGAAEVFGDEPIAPLPVDDDVPGLPGETGGDAEPLP